MASDDDSASSEGRGARPR